MDQNIALNFMAKIETQIELLGPGVLHGFSKKEIDLAHEVSNHIAEGEDFHVTHKKLKRVIEYWVDCAYAESQKRANLESKVAIFQSAKALMDVALADNTKQG